jgi:hypothetical protein
VSVFGKGVLGIRSIFLRRHGGNRNLLLSNRGDNCKKNISRRSSTEREREGRRTFEDRYADSLINRTANWHLHLHNNATQTPSIDARVATAKKTG